MARSKPVIARPAASDAKAVPLRTKAAPSSTLAVDSDQLLQLKVVLNDVDPPILRRLQVLSNSTFFDLHVAINAAMGWTDSHLHQFVFGDRRRRPATLTFIGIPDPTGMGEPDETHTRAGWETLVLNHLSVGASCLYEYDFGDSWEHTVTLEAVQPVEPKRKYPRCLEGERACPPEDCGGPGGFQDLLAVLADPEHEEYEELREWASDFEPQRFAPSRVRFPDPRKRLRLLLLE